jgi:hydrogenase maturation factor
VTPLPAGKLPAPALERLIARFPRTDPAVLIGPRTGEDAAVIEVGDRYLVVTTDPITFATDRIGWYAVHVNANDVATLGARPRWFFATLLLPEGRADAAMAEAIATDIAETCTTIGVTVCGGHTEVTAGLDRPIVVGQMIGEVDKAALVRKDRLAPGDRVLLTHGAAIEGTALLAREKRESLGDLDAGTLDRAARLLVDPGISVVDAARVAASAGRVHAMHDPTEGGIASGLWELARAGGQGLRVEDGAIPILPETRAVCAALRLDPLRLIASGALLIAAPPDEARRIADALTAHHIPVADVAEVTPPDEGIRIGRPGAYRALEPADRDEIARVFSPGA